MWAGIVLFLRKLSIENIEIDWLFRVVGPNRKKRKVRLFETCCTRLMSLSTFFVQSKRQRQGKTGQVSWDSWSKTQKISCEKLSARRAWDPHTHTAAAYSAFANWQLICASATGHRTLWCFVFNPTAVRYETGCPVGMGYSALELKFFSPGQWQAVASDIMEPGMGDEAQSVRTPSWLTRRVRGRPKFSCGVMTLIWKFYMKFDKLEHNSYHDIKLSSYILYGKV